MPKIMLRTVELVRAVKDSVEVVVVLVASVLRGPPRQVGDVDRRRRARARLEPSADRSPIHGPP